MDTAQGNDGNRRLFRRASLSGEVRLYSGNQMWHTTLGDLSLKGVLVERPQGWEGDQGQHFRMELRVNSSVIISMGVEVARLNDDTIAFSWDRIDLDSFSRLKRTLELNLGQPELLDRELGQLG